MSRHRCAVADCRHAPNAHTENGCALCGCSAWLTNKPHTWRQDVTDAWFLATQFWLGEAERVAIGYATETKEFEENHPRPRLSDFMIGMSLGSDTEKLEALLNKPACEHCLGTGVAA